MYKYNLEPSELKRTKYGIIQRQVVDDTGEFF